MDKYEALSRLLGALASVDSLPNNWNSSSYVVTTPTVGTEGDASNPHVRYVIVPNAAEADRTYCSYVGATSTGSASNHEWSVDGIGTIKFEVNNQTDLYATMKLNVKQLPTLEEVRFVPASAIGENGLLEPAGTYYQFGDVIKQTKNGKETYWVCVRPCTKVGMLRKTHWATFQVGDENFKKINERTYLPTKLCSNQSEGARMVQNLFNVLRLIQKPSRYEAKFNIDKITNKEFTADKVAAISDLWKRDNIWEKVRIYNSDAKNHISFQDFSAENEIDVFYYGYSSVWIGWGDYRIHQLFLSSEREDGLYKKVKFFTPWIYADGQRNRDFRELNKYAFNHFEGYENIYIDSDDAEPDNTYYVVKTMSGAELEGESGVDLNPAESFTIRRNNGIEDVFTSDHSRSDVPYYSVGDEIKKSVCYDDFLCCVLSNWKDGGGQKLISYFLAVDRKDIKINEPIELKDQETIKRILYQIYRAWDFTNGSMVPRSFYELDREVFASYKEFLKTFHDYYLPNYVGYDQNKGAYTKEGMKYVANANDHYIKAKISGTVYQLSYKGNAPVGSQYTLSIPTGEDNKRDGSDKLKDLMIYAYEEAGSNKDNLSNSNSITFVIKGVDNRQALRKAISDDLTANFGEWNAEK